MKTKQKPLLEEMREHLKVAKGIGEAENELRFWIQKQEQAILALNRDLNSFKEKNPFDDSITVWINRKHMKELIAKHLGVVEEQKQSKGVVE
jgi:hypothetical protein